MNLEIVSHCWRYSRLLTYQLGSLMIHPPHRVSVTMTVFYAVEDEETSAVLGYFSNLAMPAAITIHPWPLPKAELLRRAIGRNRAALATVADWIWFADCDYCFGEGCLDGLPQAVVTVAGPLAFPRIVHTHHNHELGDQAIARITGPGLFRLSEKEFSPRRMRRAIGGIQIVRGEIARRVGYVSNTRWQRPVAGFQFLGCRDDRAFRISLGTRGEPIHLPGLFRIRHSRNGRSHPGLRL